MAGRPRSPSPRESARRSGPERAPWLEEADDDAPTHTLIGRRTLTILAVLAVGLVAGIATLALLSGSRQDGAPIMATRGHEPELIASPGPWKVPPEGPGTEGLGVEGEGQLLFEVGDGREPDTAIDAARLPETPLAPTGPPPRDLLAQIDPPPAGPTPGQAQRPAEPPPGGPARPAEQRAAEPVRSLPPPPPPSAGEAAAQPAPPSATTRVQLGAFSSEARARAAWRSLAARYPYLAGFEPQFSSVQRDGETLWRLRASGPGEARDLCARLRIAGEACAPTD